MNRRVIACMLLGSTLLLTACRGGASIPATGESAMTSGSRIPFENRAAILFVSNPGANVLEYAAPFTGPPFNQTLMPGPFRLAVNRANGLLAVASNLNNQGYVNLYTPPWNGPPVQLAIGLFGDVPTGVAFDKLGRLFVSALFNDRVLVYDPPFSSANGPALIISKGVHCPQGLALDSTDQLFVIDVSGDCLMGGGTYTVRKYVKPYVNGFSKVIRFGVQFPSGLTFNQADQLFLVNGQGAGNIAIYNKPYGKPAVTITAGILSPLEAAVDKTGTLYVGNNSSGTVTEYEPPFSSASSPAKTINVAVGLEGVAEYDP